MKAMRAVGGMLKAAVDPNDSVGIMDSHFPDAHFFTEFERFDRHIDKLRRSGECIDYVSICPPNYLHDAHVRFALRWPATPSARSRWCPTHGTSQAWPRTTQPPAPGAPPTANRAPHLRSPS